MDNLDLKASIWYLITSDEFYQSTARECEDTMRWFGTLAVGEGVANFGRNNQIYDTLKSRTQDFRRGAELAKHDDYSLIWETANLIRGDARGFIEQPLHSWMSDEEYKEFDHVRISRLMLYAGMIGRALNNAMTGAVGFYNPPPECPERVDDDDGYPDNNILERYKAYEDVLQGLVHLKIPNPVPNYVIDTSISCRTGDEVPWTGVWSPGIGVQNCGLTFAIKGTRMQPAYQVKKTAAQVEAEGINWPYPETVAVAATWHPVVPRPQTPEAGKDLWSKAGQPCPKAGVWETTDPGAAKRIYQAGEPMVSLNSAYGTTVWRWVADR